MTYAAPDVGMPMPAVLPVTSRWCAFSSYNMAAHSAPASATSPIANRAIFVPFIVTEKTTWRRGFWWNGSVATNAGNVCVGIYDESGNRLATTGAVAASGNSVIQDAAFSSSVELNPGRYYMAIEYSASGANGATGFGPTVNFAWVGPYIQAVGSHPLPSTATFATWASTLIPVFGITQTTFAI